MNAERYRQIDALAEAALKLEGSHRSDFLLRACGSDQELLEQVNALLRGYDSAGEFLEKPAFEAWARDMAEASGVASLAGRQMGRYLLKSRLGAGGIGEVWLAQDQELGRDVALKFLSRELAGDSEQARRFRQEARAASSLSHNNLVTIFDIGEFEGRQFIAQEYIRGKTLREALGAGPFGVDASTEIALQIAAGLGAAHAAGIVHRDIKPENIMIRSDGTVKIVDFGIARFTDEQVKSGHHVSTGLTRHGMILGTARYMSPEQARGLQVDARSDIFSMGVVLYEMLAGAAPFTGATPSDVLAAILTSDPAPLSRNTRAVPAAFESIVRRCLAKDPADRFPSAAALQEDLKHLRKAKRHSQPGFMPWVIGVSCALLLATVVAALLLKPLHRQPSPPFSSMSMTPLATRGEVSDVAVAPDGKWLAFVIGEGHRQTIQLRETTASDERVAIAEEQGNMSGLMFSPDGSYLYYRRVGNDGIGELVRVPVKGGAPEHVAGDVSGAASVSPDGRQVAFVRLTPSTWEASLVVSNVDGSRELALQTVRRPRFFDEESVAWSPDGRSIACFAGEVTSEGVSKFRLVEINLNHPAQKTIGSQQWIPRGLAWAAPGDLLIVTAVSAGDLHQLWMVRRDTGEATRLTNDLNNYGRVSITGDGKSMVTVQRQTALTIWAATGNDNLRVDRVSATPLSSLRTSVAWTPDGKIIYTDPAGGFRNIWRMDANGANSQRLTSSPIDKDDLGATSDGRYIVYQQHEAHIFRTRSDGTEPKQLTFGRHDVHPALSPDGKSVIYASFADWTPGIGGEPTLWRVPLDGGAAVQVTQQSTSIPSVSPDGKQIACIHFPGKDPRVSKALLAVTSMDGNGGFTIFPRSYRDETSIAWSPDGKGIDFVMSVNGVGNIWRQGLTGGPPVQVTHFDRDELIHFAWSRDGRLLCTRGNTTHTAVLIQNFR
jgi:serine/threonine protein kinase/Tol biopolymer transport system component